MIYIAVCDDETAIGAELERALLDILTKLNIEHDVDIFFTGEELYKKMEAGAHCGVVSSPDNCAFKVKFLSFP